MDILVPFKSAAHRVVALWQHQRVRITAVVLICYALVLVILAEDFTPRYVDLAVGEVAKTDVRAQRRIINKVATERLREEAARQAVKRAAEDPSNYEINEAVAIQAEERARQALQLIEDKRFAFGKPKQEEADVDDAVSSQDGSEQADDTSNTDPDKTTAIVQPPVAGGKDSLSSPSLEGLPFSELAEVAAQLQHELRSRVGIEMSQEALRRFLLATGDEVKEAREKIAGIIGDFMRNTRISDDEVAEERRRIALLSESQDFPPFLVSASVEMLQELVRPNLVLNPEKVSRARQEAIEDVEPLYVHKDEKIVREGDVITGETWQILSDLGLLRRQVNYAALAGVCLVVFLFFAMIGVYVYRYNPEAAANERLVTLIGLVLVISVLATKVLSFIPWEGAGFLAPVALGSILLAILIDAQLGMMVSIFLSGMVGVINGYELRYVVVGLASGLTGAFSVSEVSRRSHLTRAGIVVGSVSLVAMTAWGLLNSDLFMIKHSYIGLVSGLLWGVVAIGLLPIVETLFSVTSPVRLLEVSNPNEPLLRRLLVEAPGTYHHSIIVGNLAEAAVEAIGGDGLLARVGAHYHDIGKLKRPYFFIENQLTSENPHDKLSPHLSALVIISHVKDGVELARKEKLPEVLVDFIAEHHGTNLVQFFYHRAREQKGDDNVDEADFRYPGPKPQSKETATVMLADCVEAAVRSLSNPTPGRIEGLVRRIIKERLNDGQLDESDVTLKDLDTIAREFVRVLSGIFHNRIEYPVRPEDELKGLRKANV